MKFLDAIPYDIVVFALVSVLLGYRLWRVLGRRVGVSEAPAPRVVPVARPEAVVAVPTAEPVATHEIPAPGTRVGQVLATIATMEPGFVPERFLRGVETVFRSVVLAFATGDRDKLRATLTPGAFEAFVSALEARQAAGEVLQVEIVAVQSLAIQDAAIETPGTGPQDTGPQDTGPRIDMKRGMIEVLIVSRQISLLRDRDAQPLVGTEAVTEFSDLWRFERVFGMQTGGASWRLAATRAA
ncbi:Tim44/TimA family putative adaptor protein [Acidomonas methanolica]|uniref:Tim44/TimA family putative adaptor protein n=1 Tax=Acidomonas methanolica TaxID=437 RepID=UPI00211A6907|nr:Tim44/TimA family putative adaptor protein [Acidomonas methanolica]MCQ9155537.1 Tim44 domain-containing protein [Acidomonas methanolica]